jgi:antitoxin VapB
MTVKTKVATPKRVATQKEASAKLFWNGRSQAVRLPKEFRFEGKAVRVSRMGTGVLLEPIAKKRKQSVEEWFAEIDRLRGDAIFPEREVQPVAEVRDPLQ